MVHGDDNAAADGDEDAVRSRDVDAEVKFDA